MTQEERIQAVETINRNIDLYQREIGILQAEKKQLFKECTHVDAQEKSMVSGADYFVCHLCHEGW